MTHELLPNLNDIAAAHTLVQRIVPPTPQYCWPLLSERLGAEVWVKHENTTPTGAFKARTSIVYVDALMRRESGIKGMIAATRGNHGQSVALASKRYGLDCIIVVPKGNSVDKNSAMRAQGAVLIEHGNDFQDSREHAQRLAHDYGYQLVPSCHPDIVCGVATYWLEFFTAVKDVDVVYVPVGQGSGICAAVATRNAMNLKTRIVGVVSDEAPAYALSFDAGYCIDAPVHTIVADGMACRTPDPGVLAVMQDYVERIVRVTDQQVLRAMRDMFTDTHHVVEGAGAASLAAAMQDAASLRGQRIGVVASGSNVDRDVFMRALAS